MRDLIERLLIPDDTEEINEERREAADEIKRLREERDEWKKQYFVMEEETQRLKMIISG